MKDQLCPQRCSIRSRFPTTSLSLSWETNYPWQLLIQARLHFNCIHLEPSKKGKHIGSIILVFQVYLSQRKRTRPGAFQLIQNTLSCTYRLNSLIFCKIKHNWIRNTSPLVLDRCQSNRLIFRNHVLHKTKLFLLHELLRKLEMSRRILIFFWGIIT